MKTGSGGDGEKFLVNLYIKGRYTYSMLVDIQCIHLIRISWERGGWGKSLKKTCLESDNEQRRLKNTRLNQH